MRTAAVAFAAAVMVAAVLTPIVRELAHRWSLFDHGLTSRKIHGKPIPRLGGIAIVLAFYAPLVALLFVNSDVGRRFYADPMKAFGLFAGGGAIALLGILDDLKGTRARTKFAVQFAAAGFMYAVGFRIDQIANPFGAPLQLGWLGLPFTMLWIAGVVNALNLIDGLDGLAGGIAFISIASTFAIATMGADPLMVLFTATLAGAVLGFLFHNFHPATIFMGDTGSMFLGFVLATTAIQANHKSSTAVAILVPIVALGIPILDTLLAMARRAARGVPLFSGDRGHLHHRLMDSGLTHRGTVLVMYGGSALLGLAAVVIARATSSQAFTVLLVLAALVYVVLRWLGYLDLAKMQRLFEERRRNLDMRLAVRRAGDALRHAQSPEEIWAPVRDAAEALGASAVAFRLTRGERDGIQLFSLGFDEAPSDLFRARYSLLAERHSDDHIEFGWIDGRSTIDRDSEIAIELLCDHASAAVERLRPAEGLLAKVVNLR